MQAQDSDTCRAIQYSKQQHLLKAVPVQDALKRPYPETRTISLDLIIFWSFNWVQHEDSFDGAQFDLKLQSLTIFNERPKAAASRQDHKMQFENLVTTRIIGVVVFGLGMSRD